jgi:hypothetical protein
MRAIPFAVPLLTAGLLALPLNSNAATPPAPKPPLAHTGYSSEASTSSITVRGSVDPRGVETSVYIQYGTTEAYGAQTPPSAVGAGAQEVKIAATIPGLQPNTLYHYRLVATSSAGMAVGEDRTVTTKKVPLTLKIAATPRPDVFGEPFSIEGTLSGSESANHAVVLQANPFPYLSGFKDVQSTELTDAGGDFSFTYTDLTQNTEFRVAALGSAPALSTPAVVSPALIETVAVRATIHVHTTPRAGFMKFDGSVAPTSPNAYVTIQWLRPGHKPQAVSKAALRRVSSSLSRYNVVVRIRHSGLYRAFVGVLSGRQVSNHSRGIQVR